jgi:hypothetical protein
MKRLAKVSSIILGSITKCAFAIIGVAVLVNGCDIAGGISHGYVVKSLSRYVPESVAWQIVNGDKNVPPDTLLELSEKWRIGHDEMTMLLLHPNFPQKKRSELIRSGKSAHYLANASSGHRSITDEDVAAMLEARGINDYLWRQTLECGGLSPYTYRAAYRKWVPSAWHRDELKDNRFLIASANLPTDVRDDLLRLLYGVPIAPFILREHKRLSGGGEECAIDVVEYMHVVDGWRRDVSFYVRCDTLNGAGSLYELVAKSRHYSTLEDLSKDVGGKKLQKVSDVGRCSMQYEIQ